MDWIVDGIALGDWQDARNSERLRAAGVESVLQLYGPEPGCPDFPGMAAVLQLGLLDARPLDPEQLRKGVAFIREQRSLGRKVLVCCGAGMSRSPTFLAAFLHEEGQNLAEAYRTILSARRGILPHPELLRSLCTHYGDPIPPEELLVTIVREKARLAREGAE